MDKTEKTGTARAGGPARLAELDGLRGLAALSVVAFHAFVETFHMVLPGFPHPLAYFFLNGRLDVSIFFVLSGEALSAAYFAGGGTAAIARLSLKRYFRLTIPVLATCTLVFVLFKTGAVANGFDLVKRADWLQLHAVAALSSLEYLHYALYGVFWGGDQTVDPFLWTMPIEMQGSVLVFFLLFLFGHVRRAWLPLLVILLVLVNKADTADLGGFVAGLMFAAARQRGVFAVIQAGRWTEPLSFLCLAGLLIVAGDLDPYPFHMAAVAIVIVFVVSCNKRLCRWLGTAPMRLLGRLSFPLYLIQYPVLISFTSWALATAWRHGGITVASAWLVSGATLTLCIAGAFLFSPVEDFTAWFGNRIVALFFKDSRQTGDGGNSIRALSNWLPAKAPWRN